MAGPKREAHPEWAAVGSTVRVVRQFLHARGPEDIASEHETIVTAHTPTSVVVGGGMRFAPSAKDGQYHSRPVERGYRTTIREKKEAGR